MTGLSTRFGAYFNVWAARDINIAAMGDSHTNGELKAAAASDASAPLIFPMGVLGPRDKTWGGTALDAYFRIDRPINSASTPNSSNDQGLTNVTTGKASWLQWLPQVLRAGYARVRNINIANLGAGGSSCYTWGGECAIATFKGLVNANDGDTVTVMSQVYTFRTTPSAAYEVTIASSAALTVVNLINAINAEGTGFFATGTVVHPSVYAWNQGGRCRVTALASGTAANSLTVASSSTVRITAVSVFDVAGSPLNFTGGSATSALYANAKAALAGGSGFTPDVITITIGTNDANRAGLRGRNTQTELTKWIANIQTDYPSAKVVITRPPASSASAATTAALTGVVLPAIDAVVAGNSSFVSSVDIYSLPAGTTQSVILNATDGIHLTPYGYFVEAQLFGAGIGSALSLSAA